MVNNNNKDTTLTDDSEITYDDTVSTDTDLVDDEATADQKLKLLRKKLDEATEKNRELHEEVQRTKAEFLNARKRLEDDQLRSRDRDLIKHVEKLLPLADSFYLAMLDKTAWERSDEKWRRGVEGIYQQLTSLLRSYGVEAFDPTDSPFDPERHEALNMQAVTDETLHHRVLTVMQLGYQKVTDGAPIVIRPARVTLGEYTPA